MEIKIQDLTWNIKFVDGIEMEDSDEQLCGVTLKLTQDIIIDYNVTVEMLKRVIIHELVHAFVWSYGLECSKPFSEEQMCSFVETYINEINRLADILEDEALRCKREKAHS